MSFDVQIVKIGAGGSLYGVARTPKNVSNRNEILHWVGVPDIITHAKFCGHRFSGFEYSEGQISQFSIDFRCRP